MFKHTVSYKDFNGNERKEDLYFHLSIVELTRLEAEIGRSLEDHIKELQSNQDLKSLLAFLEKMLLSSYGQKTLDGRSFSKHDEIRKAFEYSQAYAEIFEELLTNPDLARRFGTTVADDGKKRNQVAPQVVSDVPPAQG